MKNLRMKAARAGKDLTQEDLAQKVDVSRQTISAIEKGNYNPSVNLCIRICQALDKTLDDLFWPCLLYTSPSPRDRQKSRMPSSA